MIDAQSSGFQGHKQDGNRTDLRSVVRSSENRAVCLPTSHSLYLLLMPGPWWGHWELRGMASEVPDGWTGTRIWLSVCSHSSSWLVDCDRFCHSYYFTPHGNPTRLYSCLHYLIPSVDFLDLGLGSKSVLACLTLPSITMQQANPVHSLVWEQWCAVHTGVSTPAAKSWLSAADIFLEFVEMQSYWVFRVGCTFKIRPFRMKLSSRFLSWMIMWSLYWKVNIVDPDWWRIQSNQWV